METTKIALFKGKQIRKVLYENEWGFSVVDVIAALTDSVNPRDYWFKMKVRVRDEDGMELSTLCRQLKLESSDGKKYTTDCANTEGIFRIIQSIPSPKAEPFKRWLAKVGYERVQEIEDPELATKRTRLLYKLKGYPDDWIEKRMRGIAIREELTDEWQKRGAQEQKNYEILTAEISKAGKGIWGQVLDYQFLIYKLPAHKLANQCQRQERLGDVGTLLQSLRMKSNWGRTKPQ